MRHRLSRGGGFLSATNGSQDLNLFRNLLKGSLLGQTGNCLQDSLLVRHKFIVKRQAIFARESFL